MDRYKGVGPCLLVFIFSITCGQKSRNRLECQSTGRTIVHWNKVKSLQNSEIETQIQVFSDKESRYEEGLSK